MRNKKAIRHMENKRDEKRSFLSVITSNTNGLTLQSMTEIGRMDERNDPITAVHRRFILDQKTQIVWSWKDG